MVIFHETSLCTYNICVCSLSSCRCIIMSKDISFEEKNPLDKCSIKSSQNQTASCVSFTVFHILLTLKTSHLLTMPYSVPGTLVQRMKACSKTQRSSRQTQQRREVQAHTLKGRKTQTD